MSDVGLRDIRAVFLSIAVRAARGASTFARRAGLLLRNGVAIARSLGVVPLVVPGKLCRTLLSPALRCHHKQKTLR